MSTWNDFKLYPLSSQANPILESGKFAQLLDPSLETDNNNELIEKLLLAATLCIKRAPHDRPQMSLVSYAYIFYLLNLSLSLCF